LSALRAQLHPHFLFNALNAAVALVRASEIAAGVEVLSNLADVLRHLLRNGDMPESPLGDEVLFLERYLEIERARFRDRLAVAVHVPQELRGAVVPSLVLQPLVENALRHGLGGVVVGVGRVTVTASAADNVLHLTVADNGVGLPPDWTLDGLSGVGLRNTRARLAHLYGSRARLSLTRGHPGGTVANLTLPLSFVPYTPPASA
jgi:two-component system LytT family sensor kinase